MMFLQPNPSIKPEIIYEDKDIIIVNKPAGLLAHPLTPDQDNTLVNGLLAHYSHLENVGENPLRPGIVHRLDRDTSGLMVVAKNNQAFEELKTQFQERKVEKHYWALVVGKIKDKKGIITKAISRSKKDRRKRTVLLDEKSKSAWTEYRVIRYMKSNFPQACGKSDFSHTYTLLDVFPKTGRTHQIRVHLASIGHPIVGDERYKFKRQLSLKGLKRQFLHAFSLKFQLPNGKMIEFKSPLPEDLKEALEGLRKKN